MGGFHGYCIFLAVIGKHFASAGLRDILVATCLVGPGTMESVLKGKHYNHGMWVVKTVFESLLRLQFDAFTEWMEENGGSQLLIDFVESKELKNLVESRSRTSMIATADIFNDLHQCYQEF